MEQFTVDAYTGLYGEFIMRLNCTEASWSDSINDDGSLSVTVVEDSPNSLNGILTPYKTILAIKLGENRILHAGYIKTVSYNYQDCTYQVECGGFLSILEKRLVLDTDLKDWDFWNKQLIADEEESPEATWWILRARGSYSDIIRTLIATTLEWGYLPVRTADIQGGSHERNYQCWELATVAQRIKDIGDLEDGVEFRFDPKIQETNGNLCFIQKTASESGEHAREIVDKEWNWVVDAPGSVCVLSERDNDGEDLASSCFSTGGRDSDTLLVARVSSQNLSNKGYPVIQVSDTSHSSVSEIETLKSYANAIIQRGDRSQITTSLTCPIEYDVHVGDWVNVGVSGDTIHYKVTDVSGGSNQDYLELGLRERY